LLPLPAGDARQLAWVFAATVLLAVVGAIDDIRALAAAPRLLLQALAVLVVLAALPADLRVVPVLPWWLERALMLIGGVWFVNLVNFMDGVDWMTVAEAVPITAGLALFGQLGALPPQPTLLALVLCAAMIGFAPFNRPVARLFLGDVGSLPIGLLLGWLLLQLAGNGHLAAALLLPLYYLADTTITLLRRLIKGERITQAHRSHFYQRATDRGLSVNQIVGRVFAANLCLAILAGISLEGSTGAKSAALLLGMILVGALLWNFGRRRR
jgi:UDP-N-acetylmuramyl pentapeptide phosphotransferase/UDP-N-acetylglucosamine-1-phosphate transferase